jgi:hypothetical protein
MRSLLSLACGLAVAFSARAADSLPVIPNVEGQPLAANVERLTKALEFLGTPLPAGITHTLTHAITKKDAAEIQKTLDPRVLVVVTINPESRVKVARGPAEIDLQQAGWTPILVKVVNEATVKKQLRLTSPQSGDRYAGQGRSNKDPNYDPKAVDRFAQVEMFTSPPMTDRLSGLSVEYMIGLLYSAEAGKREITLAFDVGQGTQELGFKAETPILFDVKPALEVKLKVTDSDGKPTVGRFTFTDAAGHVYPPRPKRLAPDFFFQDQIYRPDGGTVLLPPGELTVTYGRGPEYHLLTRTIRTQQLPKDEAGNPVLAVKLERWINPADYGYYSGDHHIHAAGCAHYTNPTEGVFPEDMFLHVKGEGLNVGCCLTWGPCYDFQRKFFDSTPWERSEPFTILKYDVEVSGFGSQALGHVCLLNLRDQTYPGSDGTKDKGWPTWTTPLMRWAKAQGGVTGYAHSASGLGIDPQQSTRQLFAELDKDKSGGISKAEAAAGRWPLPEPFEKVDADGDGIITPAELRQSTDRTWRNLPNLVIPRMDGIGAQEVCVTTAMGVCDFISAMDTDRVAEWNCWYHILNCGFPLKVSGETDFPCISGSRVGQGRVYVHLGHIDMIDFGAWCKGLAAGRSYISDGYAHCLELKVGTGTHGDTIDVQPGTELPVTAKVAFQKELPLGTAVGGRVEPADERAVELVVNGQVVETKKVPADGKLHNVSFTIKPQKSSWVAVRSFPQMHTNPVFVTVGGKPIRASRDSAKWCVGVIEQLWKVRANDIRPEERGEAERTFQKAIAMYRQIAEEAEQE